jgi:hypothetical protein
MWGIPLCSPSGAKLDLSVIQNKIKSIQANLENVLQIKINPQIITENQDFVRDEFRRWGFIRCSYFIQNVLSLKGFFSNQQTASYPIEWCSTHKTNIEQNLWRNLHIVPASSNQTSNFTSAFVGISFFAINSNSGVPNYWEISYLTGFKTIPQELLDYVGKGAASQTLAIVGDVLKGIGVSSTSLSFDGLSQSQSLTQSGGSSLFGARIKQYSQEMKDDLEILKSKYRGFIFTTC